MSKITEIETEAQWEQLLGSLPPTTLLVVSFHAPWAAPCAQMKTVLETLAAEYPADEPATTKWVSINAEELSDISEAYDVTAVPFLVLIRGGKVLETVSGSSAVKVRTAIETHAKGTGAAPSAVSAANGVEQVAQKTEEPSGPQCGFSRQMVAILRENSVKYGFFNILADDEVRQGLKEYAEWPTFPQLWVNGELVGGLDIVKEELENDTDFLKPYSVSGAEGTAA